MSFFDDQVILITGGTGSFGKKFIQALLKEHKPAKVIIYSRNELKQHEMRQAGFDSPILRYFIGDIRDRVHLERAFHSREIMAPIERGQIDD